MEKIGTIASIKKEAIIYKLTNPFRWFAEFGATGGLILFFISIVALVWANSPYQNVYEDFKNINLTFSIGSFVISKGLILWINDAFANAGITIEGDLFRSLSHSVSYGVIGGLFLGKPIGVFLIS
ncbi:putative pH-dependent sodium/proton antiporter [Leptospira yanagawae serovar Saopaulo str. Sao Paulo = ATCC 700523]|uniref:Putative pH-dependent sodium/proton antiporter n=1 Tax=Leptospira yanagawae serovar Saopaulo str. Sao Paulo = ATCC 700523 TaxID=1249483 RepID=A0A5E8H7K7_9LEPT|nr:Na+/H+ antiporter NhaA [Leptospira yanagawae]EOQ87421.1 putative pH-dependent sodium/proton antiporter [Leptospira yanagawae serovar Saopaulo str. Sao Paulo = ATCC 700523]